MFKDYKIKKINNEEVLYLDLEGDATTFKKKKKILNTEIDNYLKKKKIKFKGRKIFLLILGFIIGTLIYKAPILNNIPTSSNYNYSQNVLLYNENNSLVIPLTSLNTAKPEIKQDKVNNNTNITQNKVNSITSNKESIIKPNKQNSSNNKKEEQTSSNLNNDIVNQTNEPIITIYRSNGTILSLNIEEYLIGVVAAEMPVSFHIEALKAQAIAARTYTLKALNNNILLTDTVKTQAYKDNDELKALWQNNFKTYYNKIKNAVESTKNLAIYYNNELINAFYHSTSNGYTEDSSYVFGAFSYLKSVDSLVDINASSYARSINYTYESISNILNIPVTNLSNISIERNSSNRVTKVIIDNNIYDGIKFRNILKLRSTDFEIFLNENNLTINTKGYGHGVGMSQYGANEYAKLGMNYNDILKHYYQNINIKSYL